MFGLAEFDGNAWQYQLTDYIGSNRLMTNQQGQVTHGQDYDPFGNPLSSPHGAFGFTGEQSDSSGLVYLRARYYNSHTGTFLSRDPVMGEPPYAYAHNNPINLTDPSGEIAPILLAMGIGAVGVISTRKIWVRPIATNIKSSILLADVLALLQP